MSFQTYAEYKDSGIEWLGEVPKHWEVRRLKFCVQLIEKKMKADGEKPLPYVGLENIQSWTGKLLPIDPNVVPTSVANHFGKGMILFGKLRPYLAKACNPDFEGLCSTELLVFKSIGFDRRLLLYLLLTDGFVKVVDASTYGAKMPRTNWDFIGNCIVPVPPLEEQNQIAAFLDKETTKIDTLIDKQEQLITLLQEKRQAIISHAVTRGLNPNVNMKDSGIEWLGEVPEHWELKKIKHILLQKKDSIKVGPFGSQLTTKDMEGADIKVINQRNVIDNDFDFGDNFINHEKYIELRAFTIFPGDILITTRGTIGRTAIFPNNNGTSILHPCLMRLQVDEKYWLKELIALIIQGSGYFLEQLKFLSNATTIDVIYSENLKNVSIALPPTREEQKQIAAFLDKETTKIDTLIEKCETAIELLKERRTALISAAVTGKIDVRGVAP